MVLLKTKYVRATVDAREPQNASGVRRFLGLANYNSRLIQDFAAVAEPLRRLAKKGVHLEFGEGPRGAVGELKRRLSSAVSLGYFDKDVKTMITADASPVGLGAVLIQEKQGNCYHHSFFFPCSLIIIFVFICLWCGKIIILKKRE